MQMVGPTKCIILEYRMVNDKISNNTLPKYLAVTRRRQPTMASAFFKIKNRKKNRAN